jgi:acyl-CoA synthetase (AMP-forming)/AMP-acid ligase II
MKTNIGLLLTKRAHLNPDREAYVESDGSRRYSFRDLNDRANQVANALKADGLKKGDRVGLLPARS